ncbi:MAG: NosD domain-containing protein [Gemmatimonadota bacterium]
MRKSSALAFLVLLPLLRLGGGADPCVRITKAGTQVQGDVRICPGRYRFADGAERGVIILAGSLTRLDLTGVTLDSGDSVPSRYVGVGVMAKGVDRVEIVGGTIRGYRYGVRIEGGRGHRVSGMDLSGSRKQALRSTPERFDEADWLDIFHPDTFETYGGGLLLKFTDGASITGITARNSQNGIGLIGARGSYIADNDVSFNSGWGIHLYQSVQNVIVRNQAHHNVRCESPGYSQGCDSAGLLLREHSDSNLVADNNLTYSGDGFFLSGQRGVVQPSIGNLVLRNDASFSPHNAFESTFSAWNVFLDNRADSSGYGFWLGYSTGNTVRGNTIVGTRSIAIAIEHGSDNDIASNVIIGGRRGIYLFIRDTAGQASSNYRVQDNTIARVDQGLVLEHTTQARVRGNLFDGVGEALVTDQAGAGTEVTGNIFLRADRLFIRAPALDAGKNYWGASDEAATRAHVDGTINLTPWKPASAAGY